MIINLKKLSKFLVVLSFVFFTVFKIASASMNEFLDDYEEVISVYEEYANKDKLCTADLLKINSEILPKLLPLTQKAQTQSGNFTPDELQRYMKIMARYSTALTKLSPKMQNITC